MKATSLHQPHASAVAMLAKGVETRPGRTHHRGMFAIHASKRCRPDELKVYRSMRCWQAALQGTPLIDAVEPDYRTCLPFGAVVAVCEVVGCRPSESFTPEEIHKPRWRSSAAGVLSWTEDDMGNFGPRRFGWLLANVRRLVTPLPWKAHQGIFYVPDDLILPLLPPLEESVTLPISRVEFPSPQIERISQGDFWNAEVAVQ